MFLVSGMGSPYPLQSFAGFMCPSSSTIGSGHFLEQDQHFNGRGGTYDHSSNTRRKTKIDAAACLTSESELQLLLKVQPSPVPWFACCQDHPMLVDAWHPFERGIFSLHMGALNPKAPTPSRPKTCKPYKALHPSERPSKLRQCLKAKTSLGPGPSASSARPWALEGGFPEPSTASL